MRDVERVRLRSGERVVIRPIRRSDAPALAAAVEQLSEQSRYLRFHGSVRLSDQMLSMLTDIDHHDHEALVAVALVADEILGVARFIRDEDRPEAAELAIAVTDAWQRRGLATLLLRRLAQRAAEVGIEEFTADILAENTATLGMLRRLSSVATTSHGTTLTARMDPSAWPEDEPPASALLRRLAGVVILPPRLVRAALRLSAQLAAQTLAIPVGAVRGPSRRRTG